MKLRVVVAIFLFGLDTISFAEDKPVEAKDPRPRKSVSTNTAMSINYGSAKWNTDPTKIDSASIVFRDGKTNKTALIIVDESAPDSASFQGKYIIRWGDDEQIIPEIYIPPQEMVKKVNWMKEFNDKVKDGKLKRKPFLSRKTDKGERIFEVFDTKEQAEVAAKAREESKRLEQEARDAKATPQMEKAMTKTAAAAVLEAAKLAEVEAAKLKLAAEEAAREAERARLAQIEKQREEERKRKQAELDAAEKARRQTKASKISQEAIAAYTAGDFVKAETLFRESVDLDPSNTSYYYYYGISLFRNDKNNESVVILQQVKEGNNFDPIEKDYYIGLNYIKLKELKNGIEIFRKIKATNHKTLSASAAFYEGVILFQELKYEEAKGPFQEVLDNQNSDPKLDAQAEKYLEQIAGILYFAAQKAKRILTSTSFGLQYDSNILYTSDSVLDQGTASDVGGARTLLMTSAQFRPIYEQDKEFSSKLSLLYMYSANSTHAKADPMLIALAFPYVSKGTLLEYGSKWDLTPSVEVLYMDADADGTRENLLNSGVLSIANTLVLNPERISTITATMRQDESPTTADSSAFKLILATTQMKFLNVKKDQIASGDLGYSINNARGNDYYYSRLDLKGTYIAPWKWGSTGVASLGYYLTDFSKKTTPRSDSNYSLNLAMSKPINDAIQGTLTANYTIQKSTDSGSTFNKWSLMYLITANYDF
ncbi:MAG: hypothetical protein A4S09_04380 [Proteobacteria bacterium SG_bin7]|nr:MAG: hypothetical protein A4S09_04380 [Proteobacteria bacterium SG_bin7]